MRITVFVAAAALLGGLYYVQESPEVKQKIKHTFSRENLFEVKFKNPEKQKEFEKNKSSLFYPDSKS
ncbi:MULTISPECIES: hypothetical protein [Neisseria]|uniref:Uncharacterized protein n=1 Tax=Neisseria dumasiana TaxID=1931275 RepID=A0A1X3D9V3_9NEIS|nr:MULTISPECIES: hypothetical protein [Neisseria]KPN74265.1 hypothetical protein AKG43_03395 [Neisseria sp. 74A18]OSI15698.1 hypothetical protein BV914_05910 [Neisseria dumasiana]OSI16683.1 hypothetical protein BV912_11480 [Neisseria dumasiana]OSI37148.1 hypothetical protein BV913_00520 [Neisseria dumasiana]UOO83689.1 hypothetical protein LVJ88_08270 [Neisseria dumasiana]